MNRFLKKILLTTSVGTMFFMFAGCSEETDLIMKHRSVSNAEILSMESVSYNSGSSRTCMKTNKGNFFIGNGDYLKQIQLYYNYKKTENTKPIVSFIYNSDSYEETGDEKIYYIDSIAFNDNLETPESATTPAKNDSAQNTNNKEDNDTSKYGITINNSIDTNTNTSVNRNENENNNKTTTPTE